MQEISLDKHIVLIDSPGVVLSTNDQSDSLVLRQAIKVEELSDPIKPVDALLNRIEHDQLLKYYRIAKFKTTEQFLASVARKKGQLSAGGVPNIDETARQVIRDYLNGKLTFFTQPPVDDDDEDDEGDDAGDMNMDSQEEDSDEDDDDMDDDSDQ
jgi:nuclear GTP-binding protein